MRDDLKKLPLPPEAKAYARRKGLKSMQRQPQDFISVMATLTNQKGLQRGFKNTDAGGRVSHAFKESAARAVAQLTESFEDEEDFDAEAAKDVHASIRRTYRVYVGQSPLSGDDIEYNFEVPDFGGSRLVNKNWEHRAARPEAIQGRAEARMNYLAQNRDYPEGSEFDTPWGRYAISSVGITKL